MALNGSKNSESIVKHVVQAKMFNNVVLEDITLLFLVISTSRIPVLGSRLTSRIFTFGMN